MDSLGGLLIQLGPGQMRPRDLVSLTSDLGPTIMVGMVTVGFLRRRQNSLGFDRLVHEAVQELQFWGQSVNRCLD